MELHKVTTAKTEAESLTKDNYEINEQEINDNDTFNSVPFIDLTRPVQEESKWFKFKKFIYDGVGKNKKEQKYLAKLDAFLLTSSCLGYFIKNLNQSNVTTAYVNGMDEYYNMTQKQYNIVVTMFTVGYILGQVPSNLIITRVSPRYYLGGLELIWCFLTVIMVAVPADNIGGLYAIRFLIGFTESGYFPAMEYLLGSNYNRHELSKRSSFFAVSGNLAGIISGPLQQAIIKHFAPTHRQLPSFKWLFVFDAVISFPIALYTMLVDPNTPATTDAFYFTDEDKLVGLERRRLIGAPTKKHKKFSFKRVLSYTKNWKFWIFPWLFLCYNNSCYPNSQPTFQNFLKISLGKPSSVYNIYPTYVAVTGIVLCIIFAYINDFLGGKKNVWFISLFFVLVMIGCSMLSAWDIAIGGKYLAYFLVGAPTSWGQPMIFSYLNRLLVNEDDEKRSFIVVCTNTLAYVTGAITVNFVWTGPPTYFIGFTYTACLCALGLVLTGVVYYLDQRDEKAKKSKLLLRESSSDVNSF
ncbi:unnamed protein product [Candida verbasci]|uniref:Major facilitator superfamily (MFS) profile domain-containing protein n=1 Tax=Candida verbasci TaxID=1227364 RepID=A0A9W4TQP7_9ASCO|nr:unnamed protein product [Candida verbasci]